MIKELCLSSNSPTRISDPEEDTVVINRKNTGISSLNLAFANQKYDSNRLVTIEIRHDFGDLHFYYIDNRSVRRELFLDLVMKHWPGLFDYLLFHPEWL